MSDATRDDHGEVDQKDRKDDDRDGGDQNGSAAAENGAKDDSVKDSDGKEDKPKKPGVTSKPIFWIIVVAVAAVLIVGGTLYYLHAKQFESTDDAFVDAHIVRIAPQVGGTLVQVGDYDNRHVAEGTLLAVIQPNGPQAQLAQAQAGVAQAEANVRSQQAQVVSAIASRAQAQAQAQSPAATAVRAAQDLARYLQLQRLDPTAVSAQQIDQARATARQTAAEAASAARAVRDADAQITVARRQVGAARAAVGAQRAQVAQANVTLGNLRLAAPVAGQVVNRQVNLGSYVGPGTQLMALIPDTMWITANFKETQLRHMRVGQEVTIKVDAFPDVTFRGHVDSVQHGAGQAFAVLPPQNATGNYVKVVQRVPVRITFDLQHGPDPRRYAIGPGMSVVPSVRVGD